MKRRIALVVGVSLLMTSCGTETKAVTQQDVKQETTNTTPKTPTPATNNVTEVGAFEGRLLENYEGVTIFYKEGEKHLYGALDSDGNVIIDLQEKYLRYGDGVFTMALEGEDGTIYYQYANLDGTTLIETVEGKKLLDAENFKDGKALVTLDNEIGAGRNFGNYSCVIDKTGKIVVQASSNETKLIINNDNYIVESNQDGKIVNVYNFEGTKAHEDIYKDEGYNNDNIYDIDGLHIIRDTTDTINGSYAIYDYENKKALTDYVYLYYQPEKLGNNYLVYKESKNIDEYNYVIIDSKGNEVYQLSDNYKQMMTPIVYNDKLIIEVPGEKVVILDENGNVYKETKYDMVYGLYGENLVGCSLNDKVGYLDADFNEVVEPVYDEFTSIYNGKSLLVKDGVLYKLEIK